MTENLTQLSKRAVGAFVVSQLQLFNRQHFAQVKTLTLESGMPNATFAGENGMASSLAIGMAPTLERAGE